MSSDHELTNTTPINTSGGAVVDGTVNTGGGDFVGRDKITITKEAAYTVYGLPNPYLGLRAFSYDDRAIYAGREQLAQETIQRLTKPGAQQTILFITGASGSGKSSFAQAGLIPLLESHYVAYQKVVHHAIFRPSSQPMVMLADALQKLHPDLMPDTLTANTPKEQINLLLIDQFEELFIQSEASQRAPFCDFLTNQPSFADCRTHILITLRVDYLDELFAIQPLWAIAKEGVELRSMKADDLRSTIQKPLQVNHPQKRFAPELLERLVQDGRADAALLPLLQVTLAELWKTGKLVLSNYHSLTDAIRQRADLVYTFSDHASADPKTERSLQDQQALMSILLDLINVSVDGADRRDARQRRTRQELEQGSAQRPRLIEELVNARLLAAAAETRNGAEMEVIDIIHESLIDNWDRLRSAIEDQRKQLQRRARFKLWLGEWLRNGRQDGYLLLTDMQLAETRALVEVRDIETEGAEAQRFYWCSLEYQAVVQRAKDKAEAEYKARQQWLRWLGAALAITMITAVMALWQWQRVQVAVDGQIQARATSDANAALANKQRQQAQIAATGEAQARATVVVAKRLVEADLWQKETGLVKTDKPLLALLLALESWPIQQSRGEPHTSDATRNMVELLYDIRGLPLVGHTATVHDLEFSLDSRWLASVSEDKTVRLWDLADPLSQQAVVLQQSTAVHKIAFSPDGNWLATASDDKSVRLWTMNTLDGAPQILSGYSSAVTQIAFSQDSQSLAVVEENHTITVWTIAPMTMKRDVYNNYAKVCNTFSFTRSGNELGTICKIAQLRGDTPIIQSFLLVDRYYLSDALFNPNEQWLAGINNGDGKLLLWSASALHKEPQVLSIEERANTLAFSPDNRWLAVGTEKGVVHLTGTYNEAVQPLNDPQYSVIRHSFHAHESAITAIDFSQDGKWLASASADGMIRLWGGKDYAIDEWQEQDFARLEFSTIRVPSGCRSACDPTDAFCAECKMYKEKWDIVGEVNQELLGKLACLRVGRNFTVKEWQQYFGDVHTYQPTCAQWPIPPEVTATRQDNNR